MSKNSLPPSLRTLLAGGAVAATMALLPTQQAAACSADSQYLGSVCYMASDYCPEGYVKADGRTLATAQYQALYAVIGNYYGGTQQQFNVPNLIGRVPVASGIFPSTNNTPAVTLNVGNTGGAPGVTMTTAMVAPHVHPATFTGTGGGASGTQTVNVPEKPGNLNVSVTLGALPTAPATSTQAPAANSMLTAGNAISLNPVKIYAPQGSPGTPVNLGGVTTVVTGTPTIPAFSFSVPTGGITGGTVNVGANTYGNAPIPVRDPYLVLTACIAVNGLFPVRP